VTPRGRRATGPAERARKPAPDERAERAGRELTAPVEDYLKAIYDIERGGDAAATNDIAHRLAIAPASVSGMVRRLADAGLLAYERYKGVRLTDDGRRAALRTLRRHRVIEAYLAQALGYEWDRVHEEAERLEHAASDELVDRMAAAIGEPVTDPHGAPIPTREGTVDEAPLLPLAELPASVPARMTRVSDEDASLLRYLAELGLTPGAGVRVVERAPFNGPVTLDVDGTERVVGADLARQLLVRVENGRG
jgi:DtxR family transcriptional regulator, Mn-dependent transcriptional regulator